MTTVTFYRDETTCKCCGRFIINVIAIDGVEYGTTCGEYQIKQLSGNIKVSGKTADFAIVAANMIAEQNKARQMALVNSLPRIDWHATTSTDELVSSLVSRVGTGSQAAAHFAARLELRGVDTDAIIAREWQIAVME